MLGFGRFRPFCFRGSFGHWMLEQILLHMMWIRIVPRVSLSLFAHAGQPRADYQRDVYLNRTGVGLLFIYTQLREKFNNRVRFYF